MILRLFSAERIFVAINCAVPLSLFFRDDPEDNYVGIFSSSSFTTFTGPSSSLEMHSRSQNCTEITPIL